MVCFQLYSKKKVKKLKKTEVRSKLQTEVWGRLIANDGEKTLQDDEDVLYLYCGSYNTVYICQSSLKFKEGEFYYM